VVAVAALHVVSEVDANEARGDGKRPTVESLILLSG